MCWKKRMKSWRTGPGTKAEVTLSGDWVLIGTSRFCLRICHRELTFTECSLSAKDKPPLRDYKLFRASRILSPRDFTKSPPWTTWKGAKCLILDIWQRESIRYIVAAFDIQSYGGAFLDRLHLLVILCSPLNWIVARAILIRGSLSF